MYRTQVFFRFFVILLICGGNYVQIYDSSFIIQRTRIITQMMTQHRTCTHKSSLEEGHLAWLMGKTKHNIVKIKWMDHNENWKKNSKTNSTQNLNDVVFYIFEWKWHFVLLLCYYSVIEVFKVLQFFWFGRIYSIIHSNEWDGCSAAA